MEESRLKGIDTDHFWFDGVMIDLVQLRFECESLNAQASRKQWWDCHERNKVTGNLGRMAEYLAKGNQPLPKYVNYTVKDLTEANEFGLHTGWPPA